MRERKRQNAVDVIRRDRSHAVERRECAACANYCQIRTQRPNAVLRDPSSDVVQHLP
jgi:hypothetical protein